MTDGQNRLANLTLIPVVAEQRGIAGQVNGALKFSGGMVSFYVADRVGILKHEAKLVIQFPLSSVQTAHARRGIFKKSLVLQVANGRGGIDEFVFSGQKVHELARDIIAVVGCPGVP